jgi:PAB1-binding protein PBP1
MMAGRKMVILRRSKLQSAILTSLGNASSFRTDSAISGSRNQNERVLQRWVPDAPEDVDSSLEPTRMGPSGGARWDQFAENERRFGLKTDYDENIYTTAIDKSHPQYKQRLAEAEKKAREIERSAATNSHVAEERVVDNVVGDDNGLDEEDK